MASRASHSKPLQPSSAYTIAATDMAHAHGGEYDEDRAGPRHGNNYLSFDKDGVVHKSTKKVWPWDPPGNHEQEGAQRVEGGLGAACVTRTTRHRQPQKAVVRVSRGVRG